MDLIDVVIIAVYIIVSIVVGVIYRGRQDTLSDYFTTSGSFRGRLGTLIIGLSLAATLFSGVSFLAYPSVAFGSGAKVLPVVLAILPSYFILRYCFLPRYLNSRMDSPYAPIEREYGKGVRYVVSVLYIAMRIGWMGALIYVPALMVMTAFQLSDSFFWPIVIIMGLGSTLYTVIGGVRGVIVADAVQFVIIFLGILFCLIYIIFYSGVSSSRVLESIWNNDNRQIIDFSLDFKKSFTVWSIGIGMSMATLAMFVGDQMTLQRYLTSEDLAQARGSFIYSIIGSKVIVVLLVILGMSISVWYQYNPDDSMPKIIDQIFPYFVSHELPTGIKGLLLAAVFAATMSSMTSGINALAGCVTSDMYVPLFGRESSDKQLLRFARWASFILGIFATVASGLMRNVGSVWDIAQILSGLFMGPIFVIVFSAAMKWKFSSRGLLSGIFLGLCVGIYIGTTSVATLWIIPATVIVTFLVPLLDILASNVFAHKIGGSGRDGKI